MNQSWDAFIAEHRTPSWLREIREKGPYTNGRGLDAVCILAWASQPDHMIEIGTAYGHTSVALARACPFAGVTTFDVTRELVGKTKLINDREILPAAEQGSFIREQEEAIRRRIRSVVAKPTEGHSLLSGVEIPAFQFAYIDGAHERKNVAQDTRAVLEQIDECGFIVWDDYWGKLPGVMEFIDAANECSGNRIALVGGTHVCYLKVEQKHRELLLAQREIW